MGFSLGGFLGGAADATSAKMKSDKIEREAERSKVEDMIFRTSGRLFENASLVEASRTKDIKSNKQYMNKLVSMAPSIASDPAKQAFILGLDDGAREDLITMVNDPKFNPEQRPLVDYLNAIDDPIELKDPVTLSQRVQGTVTPRPMDSSAYYGVSTTKDKEVDKIVATYTSSFSVAYGMTAAKAQGLLDAAKQEVKVQSFTIDWAHKKELGAADAALITAQVATAQLGTEKAKQNVVNGMTTNATKRLEAARIKYIQSSGIRPDVFDIDTNNQTKYLQSAAYKTATKEIISDSILYMEQHPILEEPTMKFLSENFPGKYGGKVGEDNPIESLKPDTYYLAKFKNGQGIATGAQIQAGAKGSTGSTGNEGFEDVKVGEAAKVADKVAGSGIEADIAAQEKRVQDTTKLGETDSTVQQEKDFTEKLKKVKAAEDYFTNLDTPPKPSDAAKMTDAVMDIIDRGDAKAIERAFDKISGWGTPMGQSFTVNSAITNALGSLGNAISEGETTDQTAEVATLLATSLDGISKDAVEAAILKINKYPTTIKNRDDVKAFKDKLYQTLDGM